MNLYTCLFTILMVLYLQVNAQKKLTIESKKSQEKLSIKLPVCVKPGYIDYLKKSMTFYKSKVRGLEKILNDIGKLTLVSEPVPRQPFTEEEFAKVKSKFIEQTIDTQFQSQPRHTISTTNFEKDFEETNEEEIPKCPSNVDIQVSLRLPYDTEILSKGYVLPTDLKDGVYQMCMECYYDIILPSTFSPRIIRYVHCHQQLKCLGDNIPATCVEKKVRMKIYEENLEDVSNPNIYHLDITKGCCCQLEETPLAAIFGYNKKKLGHENNKINLLPFPGIAR